MNSSNGLIGILPTNAVMVACDPVYFMAHGIPFIYSMDENGNKPVHVHLINPTRACFDTLSILDADTGIKITCTAEQGPEDKAYYANIRFVRACQFHQATGYKLLILDIDSIVRKPIKFPDEDIGLFLRDGPEHMRVAAGAVYVNDPDFIRRVAEIIVSNEQQWYLDQMALYLASKDREIHRFDRSFMDWEFGDDAVIWTGKGPRKHKDKRYLDEANRYRRLDGFRERFWCAA